MSVYLMFIFFCNFDATGTILLFHCLDIFEHVKITRSVHLKSCNSVICNMAR